MAQWENVLTKLVDKSMQKQIINYYDGRYFNVVVRHVMATTIEEIRLPKYPGYQGTDEMLMVAAQRFTNSLIVRSDVLLQSLTFVVESSTRAALRQANANFRKLLKTPLKLYHYILDGLNLEYKFLQTQNFNLQVASEISGKIKMLHNESEVTSRETNNYIETLQRYIHEFITNGIQGQQLDKIMEELRVGCLKMQRVFLNFANMVAKMIETVVNDHLLQWKKEHCFKRTEYINYSQLETIQKWCESLYSIISQACTDLDQVNLLYKELEWQDTIISKNHNGIYDRFHSLLKILIMSSFVIEEQPRQVIKTNTRFSTTIRLLIGQKLESAEIIETPVQIIMVLETNIEQILRSIQNNEELPNSATHDVIKNSAASFSFNCTTRAFSVEFKDMCISKRVRDDSMDKRDNMTVMERKMAFLFYSKIPIFKNRKIKVMTLSVPVVLMVHNLQEPQCWATITWNNAFYDFQQNCLAFKSEILWCELTKSINNRFKMHTGSDRDLTTNQLKFLYNKIFSNGMCSTDQKISWEMFCKEKHKNYTFWEWFHGTTKLIHDHLEKLWIDGSIIGYISKGDTEHLLKKSPSGTFILRFTNSEIGAISIAFNNGNNEILHIEPLKNADLIQLSLADRILLCDSLVYLYPNINKIQCFAHQGNEFYKPNAKSGYTRMQLICTVPEAAKKDAVIAKAAAINKCNFQNWYATSSSTFESQPQTYKEISDFDALRDICQF